MLKAKVSETPHQLEKGLMFVKNLAADEGMIFLFGYQKRLSFWGANTFIPLDIAFVDSNNTIVKIASIEPFCKDSIGCDDKCSIAIEVNAGYFKNNDINVGDKIEIDRGSFKEDAYIFFVKIKDSALRKSNVKESQLSEISKQPVTLKPNDEPNGVPVNKTNETEEISKQSLPIVDSANIGEYLEDGFDEEEKEIEDGLDGNIDQQESDEQTETVDQDETDDIEEPLEEDTQNYPVFSNVFEATDWAEENLEVVRISYTTKRGRSLIRDIEPHGKFHSQSTMREILVTYDETVNGIRAFIVSNIGNWAFIGRTFQKKFIVKA